MADRGKREIYVQPIEKPACPICHQELSHRYFVDETNQAIAITGHCKCVGDIIGSYTFPGWQVLYGGQAPTFAQPPAAEIVLRCHNGCGHPVVQVWRQIEKGNGVLAWDGGAGICPCTPFPKLSRAEIDAQWLALRKSTPKLESIVREEKTRASEGMAPIAKTLPPPVEQAQTPQEPF